MPDPSAEAARRELNLAHLRVFVEVAKTGSATRAAETLFRAQSAVTRAIQKLEHGLAAALFERRPSGMFPTPVGDCVAARAQQIFSELGELASWRVGARAATCRAAAWRMAPCHHICSIPAGCNCSSDWPTRATCRPRPALSA
jgi:LysR family transcriptional regulator of gallate degradation